MSCGGRASERAGESNRSWAEIDTDGGGGVEGRLGDLVVGMEVEGRKRDPGCGGDGGGGRWERQ